MTEVVKKADIDLAADAAEGPLKAVLSLGGREFTFVEPGYQRCTRLYAQVSTVLQRLGGAMDLETGLPLPNRAGEAYNGFADMYDVIVDALCLTDKDEEFVRDKAHPVKEIGPAFRAIKDILERPFLGGTTDMDPATKPADSASGATDTS